MNILCVIDSLGSGGAQRQIVLLALSFKEKGNDVKFLIYHKNFFFKEILDKAKIPVILIEEKNYLSRLYKIRRYIRSNNFHCVLSFLDGPNFICEFATLPSKKWQLIIGERNADPKIIKNLKLIFFKQFHNLADFVVSNSSTNLTLVKKINPFLRQNKLRVIHNIVDIELDKIQAERTFSERFVILIAARHEYQKNLLGLVEAINLLPEKYKEKVKIDWYGGERSDQSKVISLNKIKAYNLERSFSFYPENKEIHSKMLIADAVGLFSNYEGLPNSICEAMFLGKPVICSNVSDLAQFLSQSQLLCDPKNPYSISKSIEYILNLSQKQLEELGENNRQIALTQFNKEKICAQYLNLYTKNDE